MSIACLSEIKQNYNEKEVLFLIYAYEYIAIGSGAIPVFMFFFIAMLYLYIPAVYIVGLFVLNIGLLVQLDNSKTIYDRNRIRLSDLISVEDIAMIVENHKWGESKLKDDSLDSFVSWMPRRKVLHYLQCKTLSSDKTNEYISEKFKI